MAAASGVDVGGEEGTPPPLLRPTMEKDVSRGR